MYIHHVNLPCIDKIKFSSKVSTYIEGRVDREEEGVLAGNLEHALPLVLLGKIVEYPRPPLITQVVQGCPEIKKLLNN